MNDELFPYHGNLTWLKQRTILLVNHGSHAYGLSTPSSDLDVKGVVIPPREYLLGFTEHFEQAESKDPFDMVVYEIRKFFSLAADCNPNIIEVLWTDDADVRVSTPAGERLREARAAFLSKKARFTFAGYAHAQLKRIKLHHRWIENPAPEKPTRAQFGLPERTVIPADQLAAAQAAINKKLAAWNFDDMSDLDPAARLAVQRAMSEMLAEISVSASATFNAAARSLGYDENFIELLDRERRYTSQLREHDSYMTWKRQRNPKRAELEAKFGYDTKHASHLVRLMRMCREILLTGKVIVKRPDREELLGIKNGAWSYEQLLAWADEQEKSLDELYANTSLPRTPNRAALQALCIELVEQSLRS